MQINEANDIHYHYLLLLISWFFSWHSSFHLVLASNLDLLCEGLPVIRSPWVSKRFQSSEAYTTFRSSAHTPRLQILHDDLRIVSISNLRSIRQFSEPPEAVLSIGVWSVAWQVVDWEVVGLIGRVHAWVEVWELTGSGPVGCWAYISVLTDDWWVDPFAFWPFSLEDLISVSKKTVLEGVDVRTSQRSSEIPQFKAE